MVPVTAFWLTDKDGVILPDPTELAVDAAAHPSIKLSVQDTAVVDDGSYGVISSKAVELVIAMGLAESSLFKRLEDCQKAGHVGIPTAELLKYMEDAARAIDYLNSPIHLVGNTPTAVQHCDIKPHNILIVGGEAQLCDFGLARFIGDVKISATQAGTIAYAAPEVVSKGKPNERSDQYSLAISYVELRTGELPFQLSGWMEVLSAIQDGQLDLSRLPSAEREVIRIATSKDPEDRYPTCLEMVLELRAAVTGKPVSSISQTSYPRTSASLSSISKSRPNVRVGVRPANQGTTPSHQSSAWSLLAVVALLVVATWLAFRGFGDSTTKPPDIAKGTSNTSAETAKQTQGTKQDKKKEIVDDKKLKPPPPLNSTQLAKQQLQENKVHQALQTLDEALKKTPENAELHFLRGVCHLRQANHALAVFDFGEVLHRDSDGKLGFRNRPEIAAAYAARAQEFLDREESQAAIDLLSPLINAQAVAAPANLFFLRGLALSQQELYADALRDFLIADQRDTQNPPTFGRRPEFAAAFVRRGEQRLKAQLIDDAISDLTSALQINIDNAEAFLLRGTCYLEKHDFNAALEDFGHSIRLDQSNPLTYSRRGAVHLERAEYTKAIFDLSQAIRLDPHFLDFLHRGQAYLDSGDYEHALEDFNEVASRNSELAIAYYYRAETYRRLGKLDEALADCQKSLQKDPQNPNTYLKRGQLYDVMKQAAKAVDDYTMTLRLGYKNAAYVFDLRSAAYKQSGDAASSKTDQEISHQLSDLARNPRDAESRRKLAFQLASSPNESLRFGQLARDLAEQACELTFYNDPACLDTLAVANSALGEFEAALKWSERAIQKSADDAQRTEFTARRLLFSQQQRYTAP